VHSWRGADALSIQIFTKLLADEDYAQKHQVTDALFLLSSPKVFRISTSLVSVVPLTSNVLPFVHYMNTSSEIESSFDFWVEIEKIFVCLLSDKPKLSQK